MVKLQMIHIVLALVLQVLGDPGEYTTNIFLGNAVDNGATDGGQSIVLSVSGMSSETTIRPWRRWDMPTNYALVPCVALSNDKGLTGPGGSGCRARILCGTTDISGKFEYGSVICLVEDYTVRYCDARGLEQTPTCKRNLMGKHFKGYSSFWFKTSIQNIRDKSQTEFAVLTTYELLPSGTFALASKTLLLQKEERAEGLISCAALNSRHRIKQNSDSEARGCLVVLSCRDLEQVSSRKCRLDDKSHHLTFCGVQEVIDHLKPCNLEDLRPKKQRSAMGRVRYKTELSGRNHKTLVSVTRSIRHNKVRIRRFLLKPAKALQEVPNASLIPCDELYTKRVSVRPKNSEGCAIRLTCESPEGDTLTYECRLSNSRLELANCGENRAQGVPECTNTVLGLEQ